MNYPWSIGRILSKNVHYGKAVISNRYSFMTFLHCDNRFICGGTLIAPNWVLTAAHCITSFWKFGPIDEIKLSFGCSHVAENGYTVKLKKIIIHENFHQTLLNNDIALIKLQENIPEKYARPINIPTTLTFNAIGKNCLLIGWGENEHKNALCGRLRYGNIKISTCPWFLNIDLSKVCSIVPKNSGKTLSGMGDSGGPIILSNDNGFIQVGIVCSEWDPFLSFPTKYCIFTDLRKYIGWIRTWLLYH